QLAIGVLERCSVEACPRVVPGIEVVIVAAQRFEAFEIFIVEDGAEHAADLPELALGGLVGELAVLDQRICNVALADRDELVPSAGSAVLTVSFTVPCAHRSPSDTAIASRLHSRR